MPEKSIAQKLFIKPGSKFLLVNPPGGYLALMGAMPDRIVVLSETSSPVEAIQVFVADRRELEEQLPRLKKLLAQQGMLWVTYHKGTSRVKTDINRDTINAYAHTLGLEGVAIISIDEDWSALRLRRI